MQRHGAKATQKIRSRRRSLFSRPFACICIECDKRGKPKNQFTYKTLCRCRMKKKYRKIANEKNGV